jgi:cell division septation protein DedD
MDSSLKQRLVGATVLIALAVIFLPMLVKGPAPDSGVSDVPLDIPAEPGGNGELVTRDLPLTAPGTAPAGGAVGMPLGATDADPAAASDGAAFPAVAAGDYVVSFGSYATAADADKVIAALRAARLPGYREDMQLNGRSVQRVRIGPFADRAVAESARIEAARVNGTVGASVVVLDAAPASTATAAPAGARVASVPLPPTPVAKPVATTPVPAAKPATTAAATDTKPAVVPPAKPVVAASVPVAAPADTSKTGFAVQVGAFAAAAEATALRDRLRSAGFNAFTESVKTDKGTLTRVRVGPAMNRAEADALKAQVKAKSGIDGIVRPHP